MKGQYPSHLLRIMAAHPDHIEIINWERRRGKLRVLVRAEKREPVHVWTAFYGEGRDLIGSSAGLAVWSNDDLACFEIPLRYGRQPRYRTLARYLVPSERYGSASKGPQPHQRLTILMPVRNRPKALRCVLMALSQQTCSRNKYSVIVVDDASDDETSDVAHEFRRMLDLEVVQASCQIGRAAARNLGLQRVCTSAVLFLDADMIPDQSLVKVHLDAQAKRPCVALGIRRHVDASTTRTFGSGAARALLERNACRSIRSGRRTDSRLEWFNVTNALKWETFPWMQARTCNMSLPTDIALKVAFDEHYTGWGYEDIDFGLRLRCRKPHLPFTPLPGAVAYHIEHPRDLVREAREGTMNQQRLLKRLCAIRNERFGSTLR